MIPIMSCIESLVCPEEPVGRLPTYVFVAACFREGCDKAQLPPCGD